MEWRNLFSFWKKKPQAAPLDPPRILPQWQADEVARLQHRHESYEKVLKEEMIYGGSFGEIVSPWLQMLDGIRLMFPLFPIRFDTRYSNSYIFLTQGQLDLLRSYSRFAYEVNPYCQGALACLADYTIGTGFTPYVAGKRYGPGVSKDLIHLCNKHLEDVLNCNQWWRLERELFIRQKRDGDVFLRFFPQDDAIPKLRVVEPEQVRSTSGTDQLPERASTFGIVTDPDDRVDVKGFLILYDSDQPEPEFVPVEELVYWTNQLDINCKRGLSDFFCVQDTLEDANKLLRAGRLGEAVRQAIAYIRQWELANQSTIQTLQAANTDYQLPKEGLAIGPVGPTVNPENVTALQPGEVHDVPEGMEFVNPPIGNGQNFEIALHAALRAAAVKWRTPQWVLTGDSAEANFAAALVAESPMVKARQWDQKSTLKQYQRVWHSILHFAELQGVLPEGICEKVEVCAEPIPIATRNAKEETDRNQILYEKGILSARTWAAREDLDFDEEQENLQHDPHAIHAEQEGEGATTQTPSPSPSAEYGREVSR